MRRLPAVATLLFVAALGFVSNGSASASTSASPPKGSYGCAIGSGGEYAGQLHIIDVTHYRINNGKVGIYAAKAGKLTFSSGAFHGYFRGRFYLNSSHRYQVGLTSLNSGIETEYCEFGT